MYDNTQKITEHMKSLSDYDLIEILAKNSESYTPEAIAIAKKEIEYRGGIEKISENYSNDKIIEDIIISDQRMYDTKIVRLFKTITNIFLAMLFLVIFMAWIYGYINFLTSRVFFIIMLITISPKLFYLTFQSHRLNVGDKSKTDGDNYYIKEEYDKAIIAYNESVKIFYYYGGNPFILIKRAKAFYAKHEHQHALADSTEYFRNVDLKGDKNLSKEEIEEAKLVHDNLRNIIKIS